MRRRGYANMRGTQGFLAPDGVYYETAIRACMNGAITAEEYLAVIQAEQAGSREAKQSLNRVERILKSVRNVDKLSVAR